MLDIIYQQRIDKFFAQKKVTSNMFAITPQEAETAINSLVFELSHKGMEKAEAVDRIDRAMHLLKPEPTHTSAITRFRAIVSEYGMETTKDKIRKNIGVA